MNTELLLACWGMMTLMVLVPGPDWAYIIDAGVRDRTIAPSLSGILVGYLVAVAAVAVGVGAAVAALPWVLVALTFAAAAYLTYLGIRVLRQPPELAAGDAGDPSDAGGHDEALDRAAAPAATAVAAPRPGRRGQPTEPEACWCWSCCCRISPTRRVHRRFRCSSPCWASSSWRAVHSSLPPVGMGARTVFACARRRSAFSPGSREPRWSCSRSCWSSSRSRISSMRRHERVRLPAYWVAESVDWSMT